MQIYAVYEGWKKGSKADPDTLKECDQMRFIFQYSPPYN